MHRSFLMTRISRKYVWKCRLCRLTLNPSSTILSELLFIFVQYTSIIMADQVLPKISPETRQKLEAHGFKNHLYDYLQMPQAFIPRAPGCKNYHMQSIHILTSSWDSVSPEVTSPKDSSPAEYSWFPLLLPPWWPSTRKRRLTSPSHLVSQGSSLWIQAPPSDHLAALPQSKQSLQAGQCRSGCWYSSKWGKSTSFGGAGQQKVVIQIDGYIKHIILVSFR